MSRDSRTVLYSSEAKALAEGGTYARSNIEGNLTHRLPYQCR